MTLRGCLLAVVVGFCAAAAHADEPRPADFDAREKVARLHPGMTAAEVRALLGPPRHVARQILYARYLEQWTYDDPVGVRIVFDWRKGQERQIQTVHPLSNPPR